MSPRSITFLALAFAIIIVAACLRARTTVPLQPLAVSYLGYTNGAAVFVVSNRCNITVRRWAVVYLESAPFALESGPMQWTMDNISDTPARYLKPKETELLCVAQPPPARKWRLRVPWSYGRLARVSLFLRRHKFPPAFSRFCNEYYACSDTVVHEAVGP